MTTGERIAKLRKDAGFTRVAFAEKLGIPQTTLRNYETDVREPGHLFLMNISKIFSVSTDYLLGLSDSKVIHENDELTNKESETIKKYRTLDEHGQKAIDTLLNIEADRIAQATQPHQDIIQLFPINEYLQPASAGTGQYLDDSSFEVLNLVKQPPRGASYIVRVQGDSMEPTYSDGDRVFVGTTYEVGIGDIGLFWSDGNIYIKERGENGLISHNSDYHMLVCNEYKDVRTLGKVIGKCTDDYFQK